MGAIAVFFTDIGTTAWATPVFWFLLCLVDNGRCDDSCWYGDNGVAQQHDEGGQQTTDGCDRRDVAIANSGHSHNGPIYGGCQVGKLGIWNRAFYHEHEGAEAGDQYQYEEEINGYLGKAPLERMH